MTKTPLDLQDLEGLGHAEVNATDQSQPNTFPFIWFSLCAPRQFFYIILDSYAHLMHLVRRLGFDLI